MSTLLKFAAPAALDVADHALARQALIEMGFAPERVAVGPTRPLHDYFGRPSSRQAEIVVARGQGYGDGVHLHADIGLQAVNGRYQLHIDHLDHPFGTADERGYEVDEHTFMARLVAGYGVARAVRAAEEIARNVSAQTRRQVAVQRYAEGGKIVLRVAYA